MFQKLTIMLHRSRAEKNRSDPARNHRYDCSLRPLQDRKCAKKKPESSSEYRTLDEKLFAGVSLCFQYMDVFMSMMLQSRLAVEQQ